MDNPPRTKTKTRRSLNIATRSSCEGEEDDTRYSYENRIIWLDFCFGLDPATSFSQLRVKETLFNRDVLASWGETLFCTNVKKTWHFCTSMFTFHLKYYCFKNVFSADSISYWLLYSLFDLMVWNQDCNAKIFLQIFSMVYSITEVSWQRLYCKWIHERHLDSKGFLFSRNE